MSKKLSWILRHGAVKEGLKLDEGGYANCGELVRALFHFYSSCRKVLGEGVGRLFSAWPFLCLGRGKHLVRISDGIYWHLLFPACARKENLQLLLSLLTERQMFNY